jgi:hypothetical protein
MAAEAPRVRSNARSEEYPRLDYSILLAPWQKLGILYPELSKHRLPIIGRRGLDVLQLANMLGKIREYLSPSDRDKSRSWRYWQDIKVAVLGHHPQFLRIMHDIRNNLNTTTSELAVFGKTRT